MPNIVSETAHADSFLAPKPLPTSASWKRAGFLSILMLSWEGLIPTLLGMPASFGKYAVSATMLGGAAIWVLRWATNRASLQKNDLWSLLLLLYCVSVTFIASNIIYNYPPREWLNAQYFLAVFLAPFLLRQFGYNWKDVLAAMVFSASLCSIISLVDQFFRFPIFDVFARGSINNRFARRMFMMRVETGLSIVVLFTIAISKISLSRYYVAVLALLALNSFILFRVSESRQSISVVLIAIAILFLLGRFGKKTTVLLITIGPAIAIPLLYLLVGDYLMAFLESEDYISDGNVEIRFQALNFFWNEFQNTGGLGFGVLSNGDDARNFLAIAWRVGNGSWQYGLPDIGIASALVQFGWIGLMVVVGLTLRLGYVFLRASPKMHPNDSVWVSSAGAFLLGSMINLWPQNYFTLEWTALFGALIWFACTNVAEQVAGRRVNSPEKSAYSTPTYAPA